MPVASTTATATQKSKRGEPLSTLARQKVQIDIDTLIQNQPTNLNQLDNIRDDIMKLAVETSVSKPGFKNEIYDFLIKI